MIPADDFARCLLQHSSSDDVSRLASSGEHCTARQGVSWFRPGGLTCDWWAAVNFHFHFHFQGPVKQQQRRCRPRATASTDVRKWVSTEVEHDQVTACTYE